VEGSPSRKADLLHHLDRGGLAAAAHRRALELTGNQAEREFLSDRLAEAEQRWVLRELLRA
jgi:RNA polymerase sigma-70 factor, ECF subfamily